MSLNLGHKVGPLPVGAYGIILVGGVALGLYRRKATAAKDAAAAAAAAAGMNPAATDTVPLTTASYDNSQVGPGSSLPSGVTDTWNIGTVNNGPVQSGGTVVNNPAPVETVVPHPPIVIAPPRAPARAPAPATMHPGAGASQVRQTRPAQRYTVRPGDTYWALAQRYYGNPLDWPKIAAANGYAPTRIPVGAVLTIPA